MHVCIIRFRWVSLVHYIYNIKIQKPYFNTQFKSHYSYIKELNRRNRSVVRATVPNSPVASVVVTVMIPGTTSDYNSQRDYHPASMKRMRINMLVCYLSARFGEIIWFLCVCVLGRCFKTWLLSWIKQLGHIWWLRWDGFYMTSVDLSTSLNGICDSVRSPPACVHGFPCNLLRD